MTLLEQAQRLKNRKLAATDSNELLDVALAVLNQTVTVSQVSRVLHPDQKTTGGYHQQVKSKLFAVIRDAAVQGRIRIVKVAGDDGR